MFTGDSQSIFGVDGDASDRWWRVTIKPREYAAEIWLVTSGPLTSATLQPHATHVAVL